MGVIIQRMKCREFLFHLHQPKTKSTAHSFANLSKEMCEVSLVSDKMSHCCHSLEIKSVMLIDLAAILMDQPRLSNDEDSVKVIREIIKLHLLLAHASLMLKLDFKVKD